MLAWSSAPGQRDVARTVPKALVACYLPYAMAQARYIVGIDLGTTNSAVAYVDLGDPAEQPPLRLLQLPQLVAPGQVAAQPTLPSFLYLPGAHDLPGGATALPWDAARDYAVGVLARDQGAVVPARLVSSAKSWLCHGGVDRLAPLLPWGSPSEVPHLSPVVAAARYLQHLREVWDRQRSQGRVEWTLGRSDVVLTVPASFDEVARALTIEAARQAGLDRLTLLEEPQAAFYAWVGSQGEGWREQLRDGERVLVCDVGGGTSDFSLIAVHGSGATMSLERTAVGDHLLLGGDNIDVTLARHLERRLVKRAGELDAVQWAALVHACRQAKEVLLGASAPERFGITVAGRGSRLVGGTLRIDLFRDEVIDLVLDGFFPLVAFDEAPLRGRGGLQELGLPYANDPAVTRNLAAFLRRHDARPDAVLFNGGAMKALLVQDRVVDALTQWLGAEPRVLESHSLDLAVALGAAGYGLARAGKGVRIRGGSARAYYVGVDDPGAVRRRAVCLIPFGVEEGQRVRVEQGRFEVLTDRPVSFALYCSTAPLGHDAGELVELTDDVFLELAPLHTVLAYGESGASQRLPVTLGGEMTELGTLRLWCAAQANDHEWQLEFTLRAPAAEAAPAGPSLGDSTVALDDATLQAAAQAIRGTFARGAARGEQDAPQGLNKRLEAIIGAERLAWPGPVIRALWQPLWDCRKARDASAEHEALWLNLAGLLLRPGWGDPLDAERIAGLWTVFRAGLVHDDALGPRVAWWVLWRRVAGGLDRGQQLELTNKLAPQLLSGAAARAAAAAKKGGTHRQELGEMWRAAASLERIPARSKVGLGDVALRGALSGRGEAHYVWALGRLGARVPVYGPLDEVVPAGRAEQWLQRLLDADWQVRRAIVPAVVQLARRCGDAERDVPAELRAMVLKRLEAAGAPARLVHCVREITVLDDAEQGQLLGDALPTGLRLGAS
ncbi:MAG: Hsp70 family protein [Proteobacteria bacterium]|nr:Hsp70 family protein [Pseudomonadota bacterium]